MGHRSRGVSGAWRNWSVRGEDAADRPDVEQTWLRARRRERAPHHRLPQEGSFPKLHQTVRPRGIAHHNNPSGWFLRQGPCTKRSTKSSGEIPGGDLTSTSSAASHARSRLFGCKARSSLECAAGALRLYRLGGNAGPLGQRGHIFCCLGPLGLDPAAHLARPPRIW
ncbi:hypothetical protein NDU88_004717 [Pleurodeles waltl]|uniref:Uncharacterized protein n=1 Tax=Pleurodeles waltl TaxID=8319 RepID=A0AAV7RM33_PLEWA|nr:hypothetical protein NDU88_004717 [Pleurodeles waltl]